MRILLTNDDGIFARGLEILEEVARQFSDDIWIVAPETDQSGLAHSLTLNEPLRLRKISEKRYALKGTPTDCVIMGVRELMAEPPDLILSGVNSGQNIGDDITYSGTVAAAMEGTLLGIKSIALSQAYDWSDGLRKINWQTATVHAPDLVRKLLTKEIPAKTLININFPNCEPEEISGVEITNQGSFDHGLYMEKRHDGRSFPYYWLRFGREVPEQRNGSDIVALVENRISVTPVHLDWTHEEFRVELAHGIGDKTE
ncbi:MAG: 5'/3'-nucleotidase SurE [Hyphomicrobiales bacterium]|nr:5'/3'-nucleotidase SurE [Hyphomicrobiales bacterium]